MIKFFSKSPLKPTFRWLCAKKMHYGEVFANIKKYWDFLAIRNNTRHFFANKKNIKDFFSNSRQYGWFFAVDSKICYLKIRMQPKFFIFISIILKNYSKGKPMETRNR